MASSSNPHLNLCKKCSKNKKKYASLPILPDDILTEIIARLQPKPFCRFKCVGKSWHDLSSQAFKQNRFLRRPNLYGLVINNLVQRTNDDINFKILSRNKRDVDVKLSSLKNIGPITIKDCCNGLLLIQTREQNEPQWMVCLVVYNPAIRKLVKLPALRRPGRIIHRYVSLAYDPEISPEFHVLFFRTVLVQSHWHTALDIFSSRKGRWEEGKVFTDTVATYQWNSSIYLGGMVRRLVKGNVFSVNPTEGVHKLTKLPPLEFQILPLSFTNLAKSQGLLHYIVVNGGKLLIWVCIDFDKSGWILKHEIRLQETFGLSGKEFEDSNRRAPKVIALHPEKDVLFISVRDRKLLSYDLRTGEQNRACTLPRRGNLCFWNYVPCYSDFVFTNE
ncbi:F-box and associated interaction domains-containing protein [Rhynchospora pubera]|uniref:F-box and associated interaction domains-containing protein n=1 Tax=Rhynchospora pubera TaxID=906938 RepID=A0AAV8DYQ8_9POAL|nr:F-box and associated interaction domains-containing protein [Rhynchospora pubera]